MERFKFSNFSKFDINEKSLIFLHLFKSNNLIFLFFSKIEILEIFVLERFKFSNFSKFDINEKSLIILHRIKVNCIIFLFFLGMKY